MVEALHETFKAELIEHQGPWRDFDEVERAVFQWVAWYDGERLHAALGYTSHPTSTSRRTGRAWRKPRRPLDHTIADSTKRGAAHCMGRDGGFIVVRDSGRSRPQARTEPTAPCSAAPAVHGGRNENRNDPTGSGRTVRDLGRSA
ncbi:integrase core domain-containing protein [Streptomyces sp. GD-15H]|uniref:integrase core domain-containing protein n=1 Tax=Streptomyces sp. GD-15H TaxID=3129112 RepID=UPI0038733142